MHYAYIALYNAYNGEYTIPILICFIYSFIDQIVSVPSTFHSTFYMVSELNHKVTVLHLGDMFSSITWEV